MTMMQRLSRIGLSLVLLGMLSSACGDDDDTDTNAQTGAGGENTDASVQAGRSGSTATAGRGGSGGTTARAGAGGAGGTTSNAGTAGSSGSSSGSGGASATTGGRGGTTASAGRGGAGATAGNGGTGGVTSTTLNDAQIAAVTSTANTGEISLGMLALTRATLPAVRTFAQMMVDMHSAAQTRQSAVLGALNLQISGNPISMQLESDATQVTTQLTAAAADQFDLAYIRSQVDIHTKVLGIIDTQLLPNVSAATLLADLTVTRTEVAAHLAEATALLDQLENSDAGVP
jgi:putative membrane protein